MAYKRPSNLLALKIPSACRSEHDAFRHDASRCEAPDSDRQFWRQRHDHCRLPCAVDPGCALHIPWRQRAVSLEDEKPPRQLDQAAPHSAVARFGEPFLSTFRTALIGCTG